MTTPVHLLNHPTLCLQISDLRFGSLPPLLKNARWVPTAALEDADLSHDVAMVADMVYRVRHYQW